MTRTLWLLLWCACAALFVEEKAWAVRVIAEGMCVQASSSFASPWHGEFDAAGSRLTGSLTVPQLWKDSTIHIEGSIDIEGNLQFWLADTGKNGFFEGQVTDNQISGDYTLGDGTRGTWQGWWHPSPGAPAPEVIDQSAPPSDAQFLPLGPLSGYPDPTNPRAVCVLLSDPGAVARLSDGFIRSLRDFCASTGGTPTEISAGFAGVFANFIQSLGRLTESVNPMLAPLSASSPPTNVLVNNSPSGTFPYITQAEVAVAVSGSDSHYVVATWNNDDGTPNKVAYARSTDGGNTWPIQGSPPHTPGGNEFDPMIVSDASPTNTRGNFYLVRIGQYAGTPLMRVALSSSTSNPPTFPTTNQISTGTSYDADKPNVAVDPDTGYVYVCWTDTEPPGFTIRFLLSTDGGSHFLFPTTLTGHNGKLNFNQDGWMNPLANVEGCSIVASAGNVYVAWWQRSGARIDVVQSTDRGATFASAPCCDPQSLAVGKTCQSAGAPVCASIVSAHAPGSYGICDAKPVLLPGSGGGDPTSKYPIRNSPLPYLAADIVNPGVVYAAFDSFINFSSEILFSKCATCVGGSNAGNACNVNTDCPNGTCTGACGANGGQMAWSTPVVVNDVTTNDQFQPRIATIATGSPPTSEIRVIWYDRRRDTGNLNYDVYQTTSFDQGQTWQASSILTDVSTPNPLPQLNPNFNCSSQNCYLGDYIGLSSYPRGGAGFIAAWTDTRGPQASGTPCASDRPSSSPDPNIRAAIGC